MRKKMNSVKATWDNGTHTILHDRNSKLIIQGEIFRKQYEHNIRSTVNTVKVLQDVTMMDFQSKIAMLFRSELGLQRIGLPISGQFEVNVKVETTRTIQDMPLIGVLKSVIDGLNGSIINEDRYVVSASIEYIKRGRSVTHLNDILSIELLKVRHTTKQSILTCFNIPIYVVAKREALLLDSDDALLSFDETDFVEAAAQGLIADGMTLNNSKELYMRFTGYIDDYDIDNMALIYFDLLKAIGLNESNIHRILLEKEQSKVQKVSLSLQ
ncbi:hypothetical protein [Saccharibacillus endophyticus]|uniref:Uncharacterized protein n=1 Tax=Saccharibacillus endophyticus TaxID=2060666 RepID=A0ABQ2A8A1_9BACL|nr:hypothetical protein [Saccharibacillus endophyticus]GGH88052.1 hypothetical protein GCM10007362_51630 [Saccharibacillus endophyticus]